MLKLTGYEIFPLSVPLDKPIVTSFGVMKNRQACLLQLRTNEGISGWGESWINYPWWGLEERFATLGALCESIIGEVLIDPAKMTSRLFNDFGTVARQWGAIGPISQSISAIDLAAWDIIGKAKGLPVYKLFSGKSNIVRVYGSGIAPDQVEQRLNQANDEEYEAVKIKIGFGYSQDLSTVKRAREIWGSRPIMLDVNQGWTVEEALKMFPELEKYEPYWIEEPIRADDFKGLATLSRKSSLPIAVGENIYGEGFAEIAENMAINYLQPDLEKMGGISKGIEVAELAKKGSTTVIPHVFGTALSIVAAGHFNVATNAPWLELDMNDNPLRKELLIDGLQINNGHLILSNEPGWGVNIDKNVLSRLSL